MMTRLSRFHCPIDRSGLSYPKGRLPAKTMSWSIGSLVNTNICDMGNGVNRKLQGGRDACLSASKYGVQSVGLGLYCWLRVRIERHVRPVQR